MTFVEPGVRAVLAKERDLLASLTEHLAAGGLDATTDLREARASRRALDETFLLVFVGEFNSGKSSFINTLLDEPVLPEGVTPTTDRITILLGPQAEEGPEPSPDPSDPAGLDTPLRVRVPRDFLTGVALVDTPGTNAVIRRHQVLTEGFLPRADLLVFLTSADRPFTESERQFLTLARSWGRKIVMVVNKADLLETDAAREEVSSFVSRNAREVLGLTPPVHLVSVKRQRGGGDPGFQGLQGFLHDTLNERERTRLKLESPLGVASRLAGRSLERAQAATTDLQADLAVVDNLEGQLRVHEQELERELSGQFRMLDGILDGIAKRGDVFLDDLMRIGRTVDLLNPERVRGEFERKVIGDAPRQLDRAVNEVIDAFIARNIAFWDQLLGALAQRQPGTALSSFHYDRKSLMESLGAAANEEVEHLDRETLARRLAQDAQGAVISSGLSSIGGLGLGTLIVAGLGTLVADVTGILVGLSLVTVGLVILPRRKALAKRELNAKLNDLKNGLHAALTREHTLEATRASERLRDALAPFTRFTKAERRRLEDRSGEAVEILARIEQQRMELNAL